MDLAAAECGLSEEQMHSLFPAGIADVIAEYGGYADRNMITATARMQQISLSCQFSYENPLSYSDST